MGIAVFHEVVGIEKCPDGRFSSVDVRAWKACFTRFTEYVKVLRRTTALLFAAFYIVPFIARHSGSTVAHGRKALDRGRRGRHCAGSEDVPIPGLWAYSRCERSFAWLAYKVTVGTMTVYRACACTIYHGPAAHYPRSVCVCNSAPGLRYHPISRRKPPPHFRPRRAARDGKPIPWPEAEKS